MWAILAYLKGKRKGRLGKSYVDGACGGWGESLWSEAMIGTCADCIEKGGKVCGRGQTVGVGGLEGFLGI